MKLLISWKYDKYTLAAGEWIAMRQRLCCRNLLYIGDLCILINLLMARRVFRVPEKILSESKIDNTSMSR